MDDESIEMLLEYSIKKLLKTVNPLTASFERLERIRDLITLLVEIINKMTVIWNEEFGTRESDDIVNEKPPKHPNWIEKVRQHREMPLDAESYEEVETESPEIYSKLETIEEESEENKIGKMEGTRRLEIGQVGKQRRNSQEKHANENNAFSWNDMSDFDYQEKMALNTQEYDIDNTQLIHDEYAEQEFFDEPNHENVKEETYEHETLTQHDEEMLTSFNSRQKNVQNWSK